MIDAGSVRVGGIPEPKPATLVDAGTPIELVGPPDRYVGRGGVKLEGAMARFPIAVAGRRALDAGASTGGFTDYLLQHEVGSVVALDVGYGQLDDRLLADERVEVRDRTNLRHVDPDDLGGTFGLIVADLSFISLCTVAPALFRLASADADLVLLVKPQFEVGKGKVGKGGVVRDPGLRRAAVDDVIECLADAGLGVRDVVASPIEGAKGNREYFVWAKPGVERAEGLEVPV